MILKQYIFYFILVFLKMNRAFIKVDPTADIEIKLLLDQLHANPYKI